MTSGLSSAVSDAFQRCLGNSLHTEKYSLKITYLRPKAKLGNTKPDMLQEKCYFLYIKHFEATRWFLEAPKTAGDSLDIQLQDPKIWSTFVDL